MILFSLKRDDVPLPQEASAADDGQHPHRDPRGDGHDPQNHRQNPCTGDLFEQPFHALLLSDVFQPRLLPRIACGFIMADSSPFVKGFFLRRGLFIICLQLN